MQRNCKHMATEIMILHLCLHVVHFSCALACKVSISSVLDAQIFYLYNIYVIPTSAP